MARVAVWLLLFIVPRVLLLLFVVPAVAVLLIRAAAAAAAAAATATATSTMNNGRAYRIANSDRFAADYHDDESEFFEVYSRPIGTRYSQVYWKMQDAVPLPAEIRNHFSNGTKIMAVTGYEVDQVQWINNGDGDGEEEEEEEEVSVPLRWVYNHHYVGWLTNSQTTRLVPPQPVPGGAVNNNQPHHHWSAELLLANDGSSQTTAPRKRRRWQQQQQRDSFDRVLFRGQRGRVPAQLPRVSKKRENNSADKQRSSTSPPKNEGDRRKSSSSPSKSNDRDTSNTNTLRRSKSNIDILKSAAHRRPSGDHNLASTESVKRPRNKLESGYENKVCEVVKPIIESVVCVVSKTNRKSYPLV